MDRTLSIISIILSAITATAAIVAPIITVVINNKHQQKLKKIDTLYTKRYSKYQKFYKIYTDYLITNKLENECLIKTIAECLLVSSENTEKSLNNLLRKITGKSTDKAATEEFLMKTCINKMKADLNIL